MDLLILPLKVIYREIDSRGIDNDWWNLYVGHFKRTAVDPMAAEKFVSAVDKVDLNKYLAPKKLYRSIDEFVFRLIDMKRSNDAEFQKPLKKATENLFYTKIESPSGLHAEGGLVEKRYNELTTELQALDNVDGDSLGE